MRRGDRIQWTDEMLAKLAVMGAAEFAVQHDMSFASATAKRRKLGLTKRRQSRPRVVELDDLMLAKLHELEPLLAEEFRARGLPVRTLEPWQIIEWAVNQALAAAKRTRARELYAPTDIRSVK